MGYSIGSADKQGKRGVYGGQQPEPPCTSDILVALSLIRHVLAGYLVRFAGQVRVTAPTPMHGKTPCVLTSCSLTSELATLKEKKMQNISWSWPTGVQLSASAPCWALEGLLATHGEAWSRGFWPPCVTGAFWGGGDALRSRTGRRALLTVERLWQGKHALAMLGGTSVGACTNENIFPLVGPHCKHTPGAIGETSRSGPGSRAHVQTAYSVLPQASE